MRATKSARIVGIGECTHGSGSVIQARGQITRALVEQNGFDTVVLEAPAERCDLLARYVAGEKINLNQALERVFYWCWQNNEIGESVTLLRNWNLAQQKRGSKRRVRFTGIDTFPGGASFDRIIRFLEAQDKGSVETFRQITTAIRGLPLESRNQRDSYRQELFNTYDAVWGSIPAFGPQSGLHAPSVADSVRSFRNYLDYATSGPIPVQEVRDAGMYENARRILSVSKRGVVIWAHNAHIEHKADALGGMLRRSLGKVYFAIGAIVGEGKTLALDPRSQQVVTHRLDEVSNGLERRLLRLYPAGTFLPLGPAIAGERENWLREDLPARVDMGFYQPPAGLSIGRYNPSKRFDAIYFVPKSVPSTAIRKWPKGVPMFDL